MLQNAAEYTEAFPRPIYLSTLSGKYRLILKSVLKQYLESPPVWPLGVQ